MDSLDSSTTVSSDREEEGISISLILNLREVERSSVISGGRITPVGGVDAASSCARASRRLRSRKIKRERLIEKQGHPTFAIRPNTKSGAAAVIRRLKIRSMMAQKKYTVPGLRKSEIPCLRALI